MINIHDIDAAGKHDAYVTFVAACVQGSTETLLYHVSNILRGQRDPYYVQTGVLKLLDDGIRDFGVDGVLAGIGRAHVIRAEMGR